MLWVWARSAILVAAVFLWPKKPGANEISVAQAYQKFQQGAFILDVRSQAEWDQMHIVKSTLIPLDELKNRLSELPRDQDIVVICRSGHRSKEGDDNLTASWFYARDLYDWGLARLASSGIPPGRQHPITDVG